MRRFRLTQSASTWIGTIRLHHPHWTRRRGSANAIASAGPTGATSGHEALVLQVLRERGPVPLGALIDVAARCALLADWGRGGDTLDIGVWGEPYYRREAAATVQRMIGRTLVLECEGPWVLVGPAQSPAPIPTERAAPAGPAAVEVVGHEVAAASRPGHDG